MICVVFVEAGHAAEHWFHLWDHHHDDDGWDDRRPGGCTHGVPGDVPATLDPRPLAAAMTPILAGSPADGSRPATPSAGTEVAQKVVWVDGGDAVVAHLDSLTLKILDGEVVMSLDLEDDLSGRAPVVVRFAVAGPADDAGLLAATDEVAGGDPALAARWGPAVQNAAWAALLGLAQQHATGSGQAPAGISAVAGALRLHLDVAVDLTKVSA